MIGGGGSLVNTSERRALQSNARVMLAPMPIHQRLPRALS